MKPLSDAVRGNPCGVKRLGKGELDSSGDCDGDERKQTAAESDETHTDHVETGTM